MRCENRWFSFTVSQTEGIEQRNEKSNVTRKPVIRINDEKESGKNLTR